MKKCQMCGSPIQHQPGCPMEFQSPTQNIEPGFADEREEEVFSFNRIPCISDDY